MNEADAFLTDKGFSAAPVIDEAGRPVGVLSQSDIVVHDRESGPYVSGKPEYYERADLSPPTIIRTDVVNGDPTQVRDIMTPIVFSVSPDTPAYKVIGDMLGHKVHRLFVVGVDGVLVGTISTVDVLRHLRPQQPSAGSHRATAPESVPRILAPCSIAHYVGGFMRGSHIGPLMPVRHGTGCSYFDGPPIVSCWGFCVPEGKLTEPVDLFDHPFWDAVRTRAADKAMEIRRQGFSGAAMLPYSELEYGGIVRILEKLESRFTVRPAVSRLEPVAV